VNAATNNRSSLANGSQRGGNQRADGRKNNRGVQFFWRALV